MIIGILNWSLVGSSNKTEYWLSTAKVYHETLKASSLAEALQILEDEGWNYSYTIENNGKMVFKKDKLGNPYR